MCLREAQASAMPHLLTPVESLILSPQWYAISDSAIWKSIRCSWHSFQVNGGVQRGGDRGEGQMKACLFNMFLRSVRQQDQSIYSDKSPLCHHRRSLSTTTLECYSFYIYIAVTFVFWVIWGRRARADQSKALSGGPWAHLSLLLKRP